LISLKPSDSSRRWDQGETLPAAKWEMDSRDVECMPRIGVYDKESISQEPCEVKGASPVFPAIFWRSHRPKAALQKAETAYFLVHKMFQLDNSSVLKTSNPQSLKMSKGSGVDFQTLWTFDELQLVQKIAKGR
jgi:hypothetical protein